MHNVENTLITAGIGLASSITFANAPLNDWVNVLVQLVIAIATLIKLFPLKKLTNNGKSIYKCGLYKSNSF